MSGIQGNIRCQASKRFYGYSVTTERVDQLSDPDTLDHLRCVRCPQGTPNFRLQSASAYVEGAGEGGG